MNLSTLGFYVLTVATYFVIYNILTWGLNIQFGYAGILNFTYITFVAVGAYFCGVLTLPKSPQPVYVQYILGWQWPFPLTLLVGALVTAALGGLLGLLVLNRLRSDYLAIITFSLGFIVYDFVGTFVPLFNGFDGISGVPTPLSDTFSLDYNSSQVVFFVVALAIMALLWLVANRLYNAPIGRTMRAIREDIDVGESLGKNAFRFRMIALMVGCFYAGIGGALIIEFVGAFNTSGWSAPETFIIWAGLLLGGRANNLGAVVGSLVVPIGLFEVTRFLPTSADNPELFESLRFVIIGALLILVLWFRPQGILPERKKRFYEIPLATKATPPI